VLLAELCVFFCCLLCQFDILWPDITVREHLVLYAVIKGATWAEAGSVAEQAASEVRKVNMYAACIPLNT
jgi:ABC-type multidrug transport system ATPase subunit